MDGKKKGLSPVMTIAAIAVALAVMLLVGFRLAQPKKLQEAASDRRLQRAVEIPES